MVTASTQYLRHGGDLAEAARRYGAPAAGWLDLSTGVNPHAYPRPELPAELWTALPQPDAAAALRAAAADAYAAPASDAVVPAPGTQALIQWLPRVLGSTAMACVAPTYGEYEPAWRAAGARTGSAADLDAAARTLAGSDGPALVVCNPNNPDGRTWDPDRLAGLADRLAAQGGALVVDEAFADAVPEVSAAGHAGRPGLVVLRSFGKFFGLAGLRLGFALTAPELADRLSRALGPWAVAGPALEIGRRALADTGWIAATRERLRADAARLDGLLAGAGFEILGGTPLFRLAGHPDAAAWHDRLARAGIWVRAFPERPDRLRFGLPGDAAGWRRLEAALA